ncbi:MAG: hypothetical protein NC911_00105 [Candidatus Omnitrophica bacterium]|nr:hypothetical protein [Candidatus Omnitrophota bacterium]
MMEVIRVIENTEYCQQRLGFLKYIVAKCADYGTSSLSTVGRDLLAAVSQKVSVPFDKNVEEYIKQKRNYESILTGNTIQKDNQVILELQDIYLADSRIPSKTGKLLPYAWKIYPYLAISLGLIRKTSYSLLGKAQMLIALTDKNQLLAFKNYLPESNPLIINDSQRLAFLFLLIRSDGDVMRFLYNKALRMEEFTNRSLGDYLSEIYLQLAKTARTKVRSGDDIEKVQRLIDKARILEKWKGKPDTGSRTARNNTTVVRIEPYVDLGLVTKKTPFEFRYQLSDAGSTFFSEFSRTDYIENFLNNSFFEVCNKAFGYKARKILESSKLLPLFFKSYGTLKSPLGYASIEDVLLLSGIKAITEEKIYFEIGDGINLLKKLQKEKPELINFNIDRMGNLTYVKFVNAEG